MTVQKAGWHQGKGSRRWPIYTSARRLKRSDWLKQAAHRVEKIELHAPLAEIVYRPGRGKTIAGAMYLLDQEAAHRRFTYCIESIGRDGIRLLVSKARQQAAQQAVDTLAPPPRPKWRSPIKSVWHDLIAPDHTDYAGWLIALHIEYADKRTDGQDYVAFLFRNTERTQFGIQEFLGTNVYRWYDAKWRQLAEQVNRDAVFRESLLSDDLDLPKMWRRH